MALYITFLDVVQNAADFKTFILVNNILTTTTNRLYECIVPASSTYVNDHSSNVVYLITCSKCKPQYVRETSQILNERFNWHNSCFRNPTAYSFCKILNTQFSYCKDYSYTVSMIEKREGTGRIDRNTMDFAAKPVRKARENDMIGDDNKHIDDASKCSSLPRKHSRANRGKNCKGVPLLLPQQFSN